MLPRILALLFLPLTLLILFSAPMRANEFPVEIVEFIDGMRIVAFVDEHDIEAAPAWRPADGSPVLSIASALQAVNEHIAADPDISSAQLTEVKLEQIPRHDDRWNYLVEMQTANHEQHASFYVVLMNGQVIPAVREPATLK